jgi:signal transduction histidine kinase
MTPSAASAGAPTWTAALAQGVRARPLTVLMIAAINTGIALVLWDRDPRPFWHPLLTVQIYGFCIAFAINVLRPWQREKPMLPLLAGCMIGSLVGVVLVIIVKRYSIEYVLERREVFGWNVLQAFLNGLLISLLFFVRFREVRAREALLRAEAERTLLAKQAVEAELKLMQAQVEPHFLFNTLASVQFLTETDPPRANKLLGHLIDYLRAALPDLRAKSTTLGREADLARAYLEILAIRMGPRLAFEIDVPADLRTHPFPPNMLISLVENAVKHGLEPAAEGGRLAIVARRDGERVEVTVTDTGRGLAASANGGTNGSGVGLTNLRERLAALYGARGRFAIEEHAPRGARAMIGIPYEPV